MRRDSSSAVEPRTSSSLAAHPSGLFRTPVNLPPHHHHHHHHHHQQQQQQQHHHHHHHPSLLRQSHDLSRGRPDGYPHTVTEGATPNGGVEDSLPLMPSDRSTSLDGLGIGFSSSAHLINHQDPNRMLTPQWQQHQYQQHQWPLRSSSQSLSTSIYSNGAGQQYGHHLRSPIPEDGTVFSNSTTEFLSLSSGTHAGGKSDLGGKSTSTSRASDFGVHHHLYHPSNSKIPGEGVLDPSMEKTGALLTGHRSMVNLSDLYLPTPGFGFPAFSDIVSSSAGGNGPT